VSITNPRDKDAYPVASYTWLLTPARIADPEKRRIIVDFLRWMLSRGQTTTGALGYAPLPKAVAEKALLATGKIR
jgi:phosphate transport system substrate-binding protein